LVAWAVWEVADYQMTGVAPEPLGNAHRLAAPYQGFQCGDGQWLVLAGLSKRWPALCEMLGASHLVDDPRFVTESERYAHRGELAAIISGCLSGSDRDTWLARLQAIGVPAGPINSLAEVFNDEQFRVRDMLRTTIVDDIEIQVLNSPIKSEGTLGARNRAPKIGEHTEAVLRDLGLPLPTIRAYLDEGVIAASESG
jgi:crotonobetainyl-CoA:carnitine CoA-transferase CaiB-like acyl-CoA transferase